LDHIDLTFLTRTVDAQKSSERDYLHSNIGEGTTVTVWIFKPHLNDDDTTTEEMRKGKNTINKQSQTHGIRKQWGKDICVARQTWNSPCIRRLHSQDTMMLHLRLQMFHLLYMTFCTHIAPH